MSSEEEKLTEEKSQPLEVKVITEEKKEENMDIELEDIDISKEEIEEFEKQ